MSRPVFAVLMTLVGFATPSVHAAGAEESRTVRSSEVLELTMTHNPSLRATILSEARAREAIRAAQGLYPFVLEADAGYTHSGTPLGHSLFRRSDGISLGAGLSKSFSVGTAADLRLESSWLTADALQSTAREPAVGGSTWGLGARLTLSQPLLRGFGDRVGLAPLRQARRDKSLAEKSAEVSASALARDVLGTYWELWLAAKTVEINARSRDVAADQLQETADRVALGDAAPVDRLSYQTRLASLEETVIEAEATVRRLQVVLAGKAGVIRDHLLLAPDTKEPLPAAEEPPPVRDLLKAALARSPSIQEAFAAVDAARERARVAGESLRQRLDLTGWIEARTLGADELSPVFTDLGHGGAYSGYVGLLYELPLDNRQRRGERAQALLNVEIAARQLESAEDQVRADVAVAHDALLTADKRLAMAEETLALAEQQAEAERERYRLGAAIFTAVRDAEETVREAALRRTRARVDRVQAQIDIDHLTGNLLERAAFRELSAAGSEGASGAAHN